MNREFVKSLGSFTLSLAFLGLQLAQEAVAIAERSERKGPAARTLDCVSDAAANQLGSTLRASFRVLDNVQRSIIGLAFNAAWPFGRNIYRAAPMPPKLDSETAQKPAQRARRRA